MLMVLSNQGNGFIDLKSKECSVARTWCADGEVVTEI